MIIRGVAGVIMLFLGRELSYLFCGVMAALIGLRFTPLLPSAWPFWADYVFLAVLAIIAALLTRVHERAPFIVGGFLAGGFVASEYFAPDALLIPIIPFILGSLAGAVFVGVLGDWGSIIVSSLIGVYLIYGILPFYGMALVLVSAVIFVVGAVAQVIMYQAIKHSER